MQELALRVERGPLEWSTWLVVYSGALVALMSATGIFGTNRFVTPILPALLILLGAGVFAVAPSERRRALATGFFALALLSFVDNTVVLYRSNFGEAKQQRIFDVGVRGRPAFRELRKFMELGDRIAWVHSTGDSRYTAQILQSHFPCKAMLWLEFDELGGLPTLSRTVYATDTSLKALAAALSEPERVQLELERFDLSFALTSSEGSEPWPPELLQERFYTFGCGR